MLFPPSQNLERVLTLRNERDFRFGLSAWRRLWTSRPQARSTLNVNVPRKV